MAEDHFEDKTEQPTPRRKEEVRQKGEVARSREIPSVCIVFSGLVTLSIGGFYAYSHIESMVKETLTFGPANDMTVEGLIYFGQKVLSSFLMAMIPFLMVISITAILSNVLQVGLVISPEVIKPKLSKLDPIKGFKRLYSKQSAIELMKSLLKLAVIGGVAYVSMRQEEDHLALLGDRELISIVQYILVTSFKLLMKCLVAMVLLAGLDYGFQRWEFEKRIRMSRKEMKDELKRTEGDPIIKARVRSIQMQMARKRMMQAVPRADVVITNPTHLAVALKYDSATMTAPRVLAKGANRIAEKIKDLARENNIPVLESKELAQNLYAAVEIGQEIPSAFYHAVAEVLAYIYTLQGKRLGTA